MLSMNMYLIQVNSMFDAWSINTRFFLLTHVNEDLLEAPASLEHLWETQELSLSHRIFSFNNVHIHESFLFHNVQGTVIYFEYKTLRYTQTPLTDFKMRINTYKILLRIYFYFIYIYIYIYIYIFYQYILTLYF